MRTKHASGVTLVCISAIVFSTAGLFTKGVSAEAWSVIFWRGISAAVFTLFYAMMRGKLRDELRRFGGPAVLATVLMASGTAAFIPAFKLTSIANVALIWAAAPFVTALMAWVTLRERPTKRVMAASAGALIGVGIVLGGSFGGGNIIGDLLALWMTLMMAGVMVTYRRWPETPVALPNVGASVLLLPIAMWFGVPMQVAPLELWILVAFGLVFAVASVTLTEGARRLPPSETALLGTLETPLAPIWALMLFAEVPAGTTIIGGLLIMVALVWSQMGQG